jgi:hypothetical protein
MSEDEATLLPVPLPARLKHAVEARARWLGISVDELARHGLTVCVPEAGLPVQDDMAQVIGALAVFAEDCKAAGDSAGAALLDRLTADLTAAYGTLFFPNGSAMDRDNSLEQAFDRDRADPSAYRYKALIDPFTRG